jgi:folate-binding protein YgfZ
LADRKSGVIIDMTRQPDPEAPIGAAQHSFVVRQPPPGVIRMRGADGLDLLHRITTNELLDLPPGHVRPTILTNALGRVIDVVTVLNKEQHLVLVTSSGRGQQIRDWIQDYIFFQDDVRLELANGEYAEVGTYGPASGSLAHGILPTIDLPEGTELTEAAGAFAWRATAPLDGYRLLVPNASLEPVQTDADQDRAARDSYRALRIAAGLPASGHEIGAELTPLELNLVDWVSFDKGCYIGQEVIARMESREQRPRQLLRLTLSEGAQEGGHLHRGDQEVGILTSVARHPEHGWIGLGIVQTRLAVDPLDVLEVGGVNARLWPSESTED